MSEDKKTIYFLIAIIILLAIVLLTKIKKTPQYDPKVYENIYSEYNSIFAEEDKELKINQNNIQNIMENDMTTSEESTYMTINESRTGEKQKGNVIGQIIIPKIDIKYPIIKETTEEYLNIAPTKYCGPEVNTVRKFSYYGA